MSEPKVPAVFAAINEVQDAIWKVGISKNSLAQGGGIKFYFRGIDAVQEAFSGPMSKAKLIMMPSYGELIVTERKTNNGVTHNVRVLGSYTLVSLVDGSTQFVGSFYGEANDTQDKATAKAQSIALRQAYLQTFNVPLGPGYDPEESGGDDTGGEQPARQDAQPQPASKSQQEKPRQRVASGGEVAEPIAEAQQRILTARLNSKGLAMSDLVDPGGFATVNKANFNEVLEWIKGQG